MHVDRDRLLAHLNAIARVPRPAESAELETARAYCIEQLAAFGWETRRHEFRTADEWGNRLNGVNVVATFEEQPGRGLPRFCVGAHLDSRSDTPGADDNGTAVATLLELARLLPSLWPPDAKLELELLLFDLEENGMLGGAEHARFSKLRPVELAGMVSLEMLGYCDHRRNTQQLPRQLKGLYPDTGNFIAVIGNQNSGRLIERFTAGMKRTPELPVEWLAVPANGEMLQASRLSDHSPFWDAGYPALMITDTSFMRNPHYHLASDTIETLDFEFLHRVAEGCVNAVQMVLAEGLA